MAIEVLLDIDHTYRHDLESFFYVLIWLCARSGRGFCGNPRGRPKESVLTKWYTGSFKDIARSKLGDMHVDGFDDILEEFPPSFDCVKSLCRKIRSILSLFWRTERFSKGPDQIHLKSYMILLLKRLIALSQTFPPGKNQNEQCPYTKKKGVLMGFSRRKEVLIHGLLKQIVFSPGLSYL